MEIVLGIAVIGLAILGMAAGLILNGKPLTGSCGGTGSCPTCNGNADRCEYNSPNTIP